MKNIFDTVADLLLTNNKYKAEDGKLLKAVVYSDVMAMSDDLLTLLLSNEDVKETFFKDVQGTLVFDKQKFAWFMESKEFLPDSYTSYTNKIGLTHNGNFISQTNDVVLDFPYKDCVLEGGQDKDDQKRSEIFYNETIASDEISRMFAPKVFTNAKRYTAVGEKDLTGELDPGTIHVEEETGITFNDNDNLIIKGNNLIALASLLKRYEGKVKCIYIDPPYNTGNDSFNYNDSFNVLIEPSAAEISSFDEKGRKFAEQKAEWKKLKDQPSQTADGKHFTIAANIGTPDDMKGVLENGAEAVGLYRTEFLYMDSSDFPTEDAQFEAYKAVIEGMKGKQVIIRTCDIGGDKHLDYWDLPEEMNPFLGLRAIRLSMHNKDIFKTQLRALLRASAYGKLGIMFPMIGTLTELRKAKAILAEVRAELEAKNVKIGEDLQVGMMIEVPAAAILADQFAKEVDFFSIGTNDLIQYTMAADRGNDGVSYLYQPYNPSVLRLIKNTIDGAHQNGIWCGMCGEAAGDSVMFPILLSMGLDEYSMSATSILRIRSLMKKISLEDVKELANEACYVSETFEDNAKLVAETLKKLNIN